MKISQASQFSFGFAIAAAIMLASCQTAPDADFLAADANKDGVIDASELDDHVAASFLRTYDVNGDGSIEFKEWKQFYPEADLAKFKARDLNKDGRIDAAEMVGVVRNSPTFGGLMQSIDKNGDGVAQPSEAAAFRKHMAEL